MRLDSIVSVQMVTQFIAALFFAGSILAMAIGIALLLRRTALLSASGVMNRWVSTRSLLRPAEIPRDAEPVMHKHRRLLGAAVILGAAFSLVGLIRLDEVFLVRLAQDLHTPPHLVEIVATSAKWFLVSGNAAALLVGIGLLFFPEPLAKVEARANKWYSLRRHTRALNTMHLGLDQWILAYPRPAGLVILLLGTLIAVRLGLFLLGR